MTFSWRNFTIYKKAAAAAALCFILILLCFAGASYVVRFNIEKTGQEKFVSKTNELRETLQRQIDAAVNVLLHERGFFQGSVSVEPQEWKEYIGAVNLLQRNPDLTALAYVEKVTEGNKEVFLRDIRGTFPDYTIFPEVGGDEYWLVKYIETRSQLQSQGFNVLSDPERTGFMKKARDTGMPVATDVLSLPASIPTDVGGPIFSIYMPVYRGGQGDFQGILSAVFALEDIFPVIFNSSLSPDLEVGIFDGDTLIYYHGRTAETPNDLTVSEKVIVADKEWKINFSAPRNYDLLYLTKILPILVFLFGALFSSVSALAIYYVLSSRERAVILAKRLTAQSEALLASIGEGVLATDKDGNTILVSHEFENMLGWEATEMRGKKFFQVIPMFDEDKKPVPEHARPIVKILRGDAQFTTTAYYQRKDATIVPVAINASPVIVGGDLIGAVEVFRDIGNEKESEKDRTDFLSLASHQLRTPLSGTKWLIETMMRGILGKMTKKQKEYLGDIYMINERMIKLVFDMLNVLRLEGGTANVATETVFISKLIDELVLMVGGVADQRGVILKDLSKKGTATAVETDVQMLRSILESLVSNAIEYSSQGQEVVLDTKEETDAIIFSVKDSGIGIPKEEQRRIFERFYRGSNAKTAKPEGTGLGLYIAFMLAKKIGAEISFESPSVVEKTSAGREGGRGSIFYVRIPKTKVG